MGKVFSLSESQFTNLYLSHRAGMRIAKLEYFKFLNNDLAQGMCSIKASCYKAQLQTFNETSITLMVDRTGTKSLRS